jgi:archaellum component FlaG (FlaF/FlaG flagellin family)
MPEQDAIMMVLTVLMTEAVSGLLAYGATEKAILKMASMSCREIERQLEAIKARRPAQH